MPAGPTVHPSADVLKAFGLGKLDDSSADVLMNHLDQCADCCKVVAAQSGDDFLDRLRKAHSRNSTVPPANALSTSLSNPKHPVSSPANPTAIPNLPPELAANPQYEILRELGRGGMGVVYLAKNKLMDRLEVLKVVNKALLDRPGAVERFLREIRSAAKLSHSNVVAAYSAVQVGDLLAFAMEYVEGQDLTAVVKTQGVLSVPHACYYVQQAALGLQHAFEKNMVHRDIKPQNLILAREGKKHIVKVLDFGLAKVMREKAEDTGLTGEGKMLGTPDYIAPEQTLDAASADIRADIYSLGCTLYYLLSGRPPFSAASLGAILLAHQMQEAKPLNLVRPEVPQELAAVVSKMMAKDRAKRYQTPLQVAQVLAVFVKPGMKGGTAPKSSPDLSVAVPGTGTAEAADTSKIRTIPRDVLVKMPAKEMPAGAFEGVGEAVVSPKKAKLPVAAKPAPMAWYRRGPMLAAVGVVVVALGLGAWLLAGIVFKTKVKTADGEAFVVLEIDQPDAEVMVDGKKISIHVPGDSKPLEIQVEPGQHKLRVRKDGFEVASQDVELKLGESKPIRMRLEPVKRAASTPGPIDAPPPTTPQSDYDALAKSRWVAVLPSVEEFNRLRTEKTYLGNEPKFVDGVLECNGTWMFLPPLQAKDAIIRARVKKSDPKNKGPGINVSLYLRCPNDGESVAAWFNGDGHFGIGRKRNNSWKDLQTCQLSEQDNGFFDFAFAAVGDRLIAYANGQKILEARDEAPLGRPAAIRVGGFGLFRDIEVQVLDKPPAEEKGFVSLFNGKDLTGWSVEYDDPKVWGVEDGVLVAHGTNRQQLGYLLSERDYGDFILRLEFNLDDSAASGVVLRAVPGELLPHPFGNRLREHPVFMLVDQPKRSEVTGTLHWLLDSTHFRPNRAAELSPPGSWNKMEIEVKGRSLRASVNGKPVCDTSLAEGALFKDKTVPALNRPKGRIGLLKSFRMARFRNIEIKELTP